MTTYDFILQGSEATEENAKDFAQDLDWNEVSKTENNGLPYLDYIETLNGVDIWYDYKGGYYIFSDENDI